jgi:hypothetical protein
MSGAATERRPAPADGDAIDQVVIAQRISLQQILRDTHLTPGPAAVCARFMLGVCSKFLHSLERTRVDLDPSVRHGAAAAESAPDDAEPGHGRQSSESTQVVPMKVASAKANSDMIRKSRVNGVSRAVSSVVARCETLDAQAEGDGLKTVIAAHLFSRSSPTQRHARCTGSTSPTRFPSTRHTGSTSPTRSSSPSRRSLRRHSPTSNCSSPRHDHSLTHSLTSVARCASRRTQAKLSSQLEIEVGCAEPSDASERTSPRPAPCDSPTSAKVGSYRRSFTPTHAKMSSWDLDDNVVSASTTSAGAPEACLSRSAIVRDAKLCLPIDGNFSPPAAGGLRGFGQKEDDSEEEGMDFILDVLHRWESAQGALDETVPQDRATGKQRNESEPSSSCSEEQEGLEGQEDTRSVPQRLQRGPSRPCTSPERSTCIVGRSSTEYPVRVRAHEAQSPAGSPARVGGIPVSGFGAGARARKRSPVRVADTPSRSPTRSRHVNIAMLTKPQQRAALLRERYANQKFPETLQREMERETQASPHASPRSEPLGGLQPCQDRSDPTVHGGVGMSGGAGGAGGDRSVPLGAKLHTELECDFADNLSFVPPPDDAQLAMRAGGMDKRVSQRGAAENDGSQFTDVTVRGGVPLSKDRISWAGRSESEKRRLERIRELEERMREEGKRKATKAAQEELMALVESAQRSGSVVVYYRVSESTDFNARSCGKVCCIETAPPHLFLLIYMSRCCRCACTRACVCACTLACLGTQLSWQVARAHRLHVLCRNDEMVQAAERSSVFLNPQ